MAPTRKPDKLEPNSVYTDRELTAYFGVGPKFFARLRKYGRGPAYFNPDGGRLVRYMGRDVIIWAKMHVRFSTVSHLTPKPKTRKLKVFIGWSRNGDLDRLNLVRSMLG